MEKGKIPLYKRHGADSVAAKHNINPIGNDVNAKQKKYYATLDKLENSAKLVL